MLLNVAMLNVKMFFSTLTLCWFFYTN